MRKKYIHLKGGLNLEDVQYMHPNLLMLYAFISVFCYENGIKFVVTSMYRTPEKDALIGAQSKTHQQDRAFDFSIKSEHGWDYEKIQKLVDEIQNYKVIDKNGKEVLYFMEIGARVWADKEKTRLLSRPIIIHKVKNGALHAHVQVKP